MSRYRLGFDIGGTFTDFVLLDVATGHMQIFKYPTTPHDPSEGVLAGLVQLLRETNTTAATLENVVHGTTLVSNALIERNGARVGLLTTTGFRDTLEIRTEQRYDIYDLFLRYPEPLVPRQLRLEIGERVDRTGRVLQSVDPAEVLAHLETFQANQVEAIAICFLHAFRNPVNEQAVAEIIARHWPEVPLSLSSRVAPEIREYPRTSTTVANAYVQPMMRQYLTRLETALAEHGFTGSFHLMLSSGSACTVETATNFPVRLVESGAAAGALAASFYCRLAGREDLVAFDMGGTTAKVTLIHNGRPTLASNLEVAREHRFKAGSGIPLQFPAIDLLEVGAGGGSIAWVDQLGLLKIGPASAGADPGPACYGHGGTQPTVTDADLILGYLNPDYFLGGEMPLNPAAAHEAIATVAGQLGLSPIDTAWGIHQLVNENMAAAARIHIIEKARDPRRYALLAFGGAGPLHAAGVADVLGASEVICPPAAGVASAVGLLAAPMAFEFVRSYPIRLSEIDWETVNQLFEEMETQGRAMLAEAGMDQEWHVQRSVDGRFVGQLHELNLTLPAHPLGPEDQDELTQAFKTRYQERYSHLPAEMPIEFLSWRTTVTGPLPTINVPRYAATHDENTLALKGERQAYFASAGTYLPTPVYDRYRLRPAMSGKGPAIIEERECTVLVPPDWAWTVDAYQNLILSKE